MRARSSPPRPGHTCESGPGYPAARRRGWRHVIFGFVADSWSPGLRIARVKLEVAVQQRERLGRLAAGGTTRRGIGRSQTLGRARGSHPLPKRSPLWLHVALEPRGKFVIARRGVESLVDHVTDFPVLQVD